MTHSGTCTDTGTSTKNLVQDNQHGGSGPLWNISWKNLVTPNIILGHQSRKELIKKNASYGMINKPNKSLHVYKHFTFLIQGSDLRLYTGTHTTPMLVKSSKDTCLLLRQRSCPDAIATARSEICFRCFLKLLFLNTKELFSCFLSELKPVLKDKILNHFYRE